MNYSAPPSRSTRLHQLLLAGFLLLCACAPAAQQGLLYDAQRLIVVQLEGDSCRHNQDMYFAPAI